MCLYLDSQLQRLLPPFPTMHWLASCSVRHVAQTASCPNKCARGNDLDLVPHFEHDGLAKIINAVNYPTKHPKQFGYGAGLL